MREGWLYRVKSKGTFVAQRKIQQDFIRRLESFNEQIERTGRRPGTELLALEVVEMPERAAEAFGVAPGEKVVYLHRKRSADAEPIVTVETYLPYPKCAFLMQHNMAKESMYNVLAEREETRICRVSRILEAVAANAQDARLLNIRTGKPVHLFHTVGYNQYDEPIEFSIARYRGDRNRFEVDLLIDTSLK